MITHFKNSKAETKAVGTERKRFDDREIFSGDFWIREHEAGAPAQPVEAFDSFSHLAAAGSAWGLTWQNAGGGLRRSSPV